MDGGREVVAGEASGLRMRRVYKWALLSRTVHTVAVPLPFELSSTSGAMSCCGDRHQISCTDAAIVSTSRGYNIWTAANVSC